MYGPRFERSQTIEDQTRCVSYPNCACFRANEANNRGFAFLEMKEYSKSKESFRSALKLCCGEETPSKIPMSDGEGDLSSMIPLPTEKKEYRQRSEYDEGMDYFDSSILNYECTNNQVALFLYNLGRVYYHEYKYEKAIAFYRRSLFVLDNSEKCDAKTILAVLFAIAQLQYLRNEYTQALQTYFIAETLSRDCFGNESVQLAATLNCIGVVRYCMPSGDPNQAMKVLHQSLALRIRLQGQPHLDVGTSYNNIGRVHFQLGDYQKAMEAYKTALTIRRGVLGESIDVAATIFNMGQAYHQLDDRTQAMKLYKDYLALAGGHFGEFHRDIAIVLTCIGQLYHEEKDYQDAMNAYQAALRVGKKALGQFHPEIAITLNKVSVRFNPKPRGFVSQFKLLTSYYYIPIVLSPYRLAILITRWVTCLPPWRFTKKVLLWKRPSSRTETPTSW